MTTPDRSVPATDRPYLDDGDVRLYHGHVLDVLAQLPEQSAQTCVTSPPYWGLRDYGEAGQIGLEESPEQFVAAMVDVFRGVRRVLRDDGTLWLNLGDSYAGSWGNQGRKDERGGQRAVNGPMIQRLSTGATHAIDCDMGDDCTCGAQTDVYPQRTHTGSWVNDHPTIKDKDLIGIPWLVAFALQADGWYRRSAIVWAKPNPMPESVTDRPTSSYEMVFLFAKSRRYFYDADAIREPDAGLASGNGFAGRQGGASYHARDGGTGSDKRFTPGAGRNARNVWTIPTQPFPDAHFATFPEELPRRCILAGTSEHGACSACGAPWERVVRASVVERSDLPAGDPRRRPARYDGGKNGEGVYAGTGQRYTSREHGGWRPSCQCDAPVRPCVVLDPFIGSGTTAKVARDHGRHAIGIDLNADYLAIAAKRLRQLSLLADAAQ